MSGALPAAGPDTSSVQCPSVAGVGWLPIAETIEAHSDVFHHPRDALFHL